MMNWRQRQQQKGATDMCWSILPPQFYDYLVDSCTKNTVSFANGKSGSFLSFFDVDYVYFPLCVENNEWLLVQVELRNVNLVMFCSECFSSENYRRAVHPKLMQISVYFCALLVNIKYFKKTGFPPKLMSFEVNEDYVQSNADLYGNQGVHACMLMEHLVTSKPLNISNNFRESCIAYRRFMANQMLLKAQFQYTSLPSSSHSSMLGKFARIFAGGFTGGIKSRFTGGFITGYTIGGWMFGFTIGGWMSSSSLDVSDKFSGGGFGVEKLSFLLLRHFSINMQQ
ncbi:hypothetical protein R6Q57_020384 [Mikania cordata]